MSEPEAGFTALVLAGERAAGDPVAAAAGVGQKCWAPVAGVPMLVRVVEALAASPAVARIAVVTDTPDLAGRWPGLRPLAAAGRLAALPCGTTPAGSVLSAAAALDAPFPLLITTADHPLLTPEMIAHFCRAGREQGATVIAGLTRAEVITARYPETRRTYLRFRDARRSGANLFALMDREGLKAVAFWRRVERDRKRPWRIFRAFGLWPLVLYALGRLSAADAMRRASDILGVSVGALDLPFAEAAIDVDKPADLALVERILEAREDAHVPAGSPL